jgi:hypothetical protein
VRSYQRDSLQILNLQDLLSDVIRSLIGKLYLRRDKLCNSSPGKTGSRRFLANQTAVSVLTKIWYFGSTFGLGDYHLSLKTKIFQLILGDLTGSQTLGEEYVEIYPYVNRRRNFPSRLVSLRCSTSP